jgi:NADPH2:quinone reductase
MTPTLTEVDQIRELLASYETALNTSDAVAAAAAYAPDGQFFPNNQPTASGPRIRTAYEAIFDSMRLTIEFDVHEVVVDRDLAYATTGSKGTVTVLATNDTVAEESRELFVFARVDGSWRIARYLFNKAAARTVPGASRPDLRCAFGDGALPPHRAPRVLRGSWPERRRPTMTSSELTTAVVATAFGSPDVLSLIDAPIGQPGPGEVRIHVHAAGTNPIDFKLYSGVLGQDSTKLPMRLGLEAAGVVTAVADGAERPAGPLHVGDEVIAFPVEGAYAADIVVPASSVVPKPSTLSFEQASGLMLAGTTAVHALKVAAVGSGDTVVIHGASGCVGLVAVQLAVAAGARVIATASESRHPYLCALGAEPVAYGEGLLERIRTIAPDGVDAALDAIGSNEAIDTSVALLARRDRIVTVAAPQSGFELGPKVLGGMPGADPGTDVRAAARLGLVRQAEAGELRILQAAVYPLAEAGAAHQALATGHTHGKIALIP